MERTARGYRLSSGREFYANGGLISIARLADGTFRMAEGYDGVMLEAVGDAYPTDENFTIDERRELADFMIAQWSAFRDSIELRKG